MDPISNAFGSVTVETILLYCAAIAAICGIAYKAYNFIVTIHDTVQNERKVFKELQAEVQTMKTSQGDLTTNIESILTQLTNIESKMDTIEKANRVREQNTLRDRILQIHSYQTNPQKNPMSAWSEMERDSFDRLLKDYYDLDGNGYVKNTVEPEMRNLIVVSMSDTNGITKLMQSRKG